MLPQVLLFTLVRIVFNTSYRMVYPFLAVFARGLGVELSALALAITARSLTGAVGVFIAPLADQRGRKPAMLSGVAVFCLGLGLVVLRPTYATFFAALILSTIGSYIFLPSMQAYLGDRVPYNRRGFTMAVTELSWGLSFIVGIPLVGFLIARLGWMSPFWLLSLLGLLSLALLAARIPADPPAAPAGSNPWKNLRMVLSHPAAIAGLALSLLLTTANETINLVFGVWMEDSFGLQIAALGAASVVIGLSELSGEVFSGGLVDRLGKERSIAAGILLNCLAALALPFLGRTVPGALAGLFLFYLTYEFSVVCALPLLSAIYPEARATLMALNVAAFSLGRGVGATLAAPLYQSGILPCALASVVFNILALLALRHVKVKES